MKRIFLAALLALPCFADVKIARNGDRIDVTIDGQPFTTFYIAGASKPYLHPLRSPSGKIVTRQYPMEKVAGETADHPHHRGLWFSHGDVNGIDFWAAEPSSKNPKQGRIVLEKIDHASGGGKKGTIEGTFNWVGPGGKTLLTEHRVMTFYSGGKNRVIDFDIDLKAAEKVVFGDTKEGTFAIRLADILSEKKTGTMVSAEGAEKMKNIWGKKSPWVDYAGTLEGEKVGVAIFDHPQNPRHPTSWHARDYGLFAANIFGQHDFLDDKSKDGSMTIEPGKSVRFRYRVVIHPGDTAEADVKQLYADYAKAGH